MSETYETRQFMSLYKTYEGLLRDHDTDYRTVEEKQDGSRMTIMRQMRNYLSHAEDPGFIAISPICLNFLEKLVKEEQMKGDLVKNHLVTPAKGSIKEGTPLSKVICRLSALTFIGQFELPVYEPETRRLKGVVCLERMAYELDRKGNIPLTEDICGPYGKGFHLVKPDDTAPKNVDDRFYCCTKDGTMDTQYMGYLDK